MASLTTASKPPQMDYKGLILYVGSLAVGAIDTHLQTIGLFLNIVYIGVQIYKAGKKNEK